MGCGIKIKHDIDDQTIIDNCQISKMKISMLKHYWQYFKIVDWNSEMNTSGNLL